METAIHNGTDGGWQQETSYEEEVELVWHSSDLGFEGILRLRAYDAGKSGCLEVFVGNGKASEWTRPKVRECYNEVEQEDEDRQSILEDQSQVREGPRCRTYTLNCNCVQLEDYIWWILSGHGKRQCSGQYDWKAPNRILVVQDSMNRREAKVFRAHAAPQGMCGNLINAETLGRPTERWRQSSEDDRARFAGKIGAK